MRHEAVLIARRIGSLSMTISLALVMVSLMPTTPSGYVYGWGGFVGPGKYEPSRSSGICSSRTGFRITGESNDSMEIYIIGMGRSEFLRSAKAYVIGSHPDLNETELWDLDPMVLDLAVLEEYLQEQGDSVLWRVEVDGTWELDYFPRTITNTTLVSANPSETYVDFHVEVARITKLAPRERLLMAASLLLSTGLILFMLGRIWSPR